MLLVDSHCHLDRLDLSPYPGGLDDVLAEARAVGVGRFLCISVTPDDFPVLQRIAQRHADVALSYGVHPTEQVSVEPSEADLIQYGQRPDVVAIGETGLDYYYVEQGAGWQRERFIAHIRAACAVNKPLIIHCRDAFDDTYALLETHGIPAVGSIMHCFTGNVAQAERALELGLTLSFSGIVTFKNARDLQAAARITPLDRCLVETDAPYLSPMPHRGKPNYPSRVRHTAEYLAALHEVDLATIAARTTATFFQLFPQLA